jgi:hypothetical protein
MSTITVSSAVSKNVSGTVSGSGMPVISATTSFRLATCWTLMVVKTSMPPASSSSTSFQRLGWREPSGLACARSSISTTCGLRAAARVEVELAVARSCARLEVGAARPPRLAVHVEHADHDVAPASSHAAGSGEHRFGLAGAGERAEEDLELAAGRRSVQASDYLWLECSCRWKTRCSWPRPSSA